MPEWSRNGKELFYRTNDSKIMVVSYTSSGDSFHAEKPRLWSPGQFTDRLTDLNYSTASRWQTLRRAESFQRDRGPSDQQSQLHLQFLRRAAPQSARRKELTQAW